MSVGCVCSGSFSCNCVRINQESRGDQAAAGAAVGPEKDAGVVVQAPPPTVFSESGASGPRNMLARNFAGGISTDSKYLKATLSSFMVGQNLKMGAQASLLDLAGGVMGSSTSGKSKFTDALLHSFEVARLAKNEKNQKTGEASEESLEKAREEIKEDADEATENAAEKAAATVTGDDGAEQDLELVPLGELVEQAADETSPDQGAASEDGQNDVAGSLSPAVDLFV